MSSLSFLLKVNAICPFSQCTNISLAGVRVNCLLTYLWIIIWWRRIVRYTSRCRCLKRTFFTRWALHKCRESIQVFPGEETVKNSIQTPTIDKPEQCKQINILDMPHVSVGWNKAKHRQHTTRGVKMNIDLQ